ncbi:CLUMA_CG005867, isoform A [Clunio marinus]|uniref:CLUMA_CG005867, isoform A n=1 Tax=Clunio marinus TaxID=568069 RepID=A0A1J1HW69_9DIPT|nr:CLUMA_CG005867, isoform A [Clunio marinus]
MTEHKSMTSGWGKWENFTNLILLLKLCINVDSTFRSLMHERGFIDHLCRPHELNFIARCILAELEFNLYSVSCYHNTTSVHCRTSDCDVSTFDAPTCM